jgi:hypothetical protein
MTSSHPFTVLRVFPVFVATLASACAMPGDQVNTSMTQDEIASASSAAICPDTPDGSPYCHAFGLVDAAGHLITHPAPAGFGPSQLRSAYKITTSGSSSTLIAVISAYDYATAEADLATYRAQFGLPPCRSSTGCFRKVDQSGGTSYPGPNFSWNLGRRLTSTW